MKPDDPEETLGAEPQPTLPFERQGPAGAGDPPLPDAPVLTGARYVPLRHHARGGLGEVFVARDSELGREVALKAIQPQHADNPTNRFRFVREAEITGN